ncbi:hypothetical protein NDR87_27320 [Nocardia sp. CDC159]|uniref:Heavy metal-binding domain-containing protein n=1 Tax=Nocardia pulmonis TaxID=2951408 RepID=A0A9X2IZZ5_9NOCA|nr:MULTISPECIES: hypothetical protein [Nocardia]MCM6777204.1 hypothetical protein [Nocardia pulmonis]MCM6790089.1 hypothetical protein [Nocardia sp. CDC159]
MNDRLRFAAFGGGLVVLFGAALGLGALVGDRIGAAPGHGESHSAPANPAAGTGSQAAAAGYTLAELSAPAEVNRPGALRLRIDGPGGEPVTRFNTLHEKQLHLIAVRTDTTRYRHVHPQLAADGTWSIDWTWAEPGVYRVFADFAPADGPGELVLSRTFTVTGAAETHPLPPRSNTAEVDGYRVILAGEPRTGGSELRFTVTRDGRPVTDLEPYLGAYAHLVALRANDLTYLHVHPEGAVGSTPSGPQVAFHAQAPGDGAYRLYLDFAHGGSVHTAEFTVETAAGGATGEHDDHGGGHQ